MSNDTSNNSNDHDPSSVDPVEAIASQERWSELIDLSDFIGHDGKPLGEVRVVVLKKREEWDAQREAHAENEALRDSLTGGRDSFREDETVLADMKDAFAVYKALRKADNPDQFAFPAPQWLVDHLDNEQLGTLARLCNQMRARKSGVPYTFTEKFIRDIKAAIVEHEQQGFPGEWPLAQFSRAQLDIFLVEAMRVWTSDLQKLVKDEDPK